jgi:hypothetical protein
VLYVTGWPGRDDTDSLIWLQVYGVFGLQYRMALSTRPEKYMGDLALWGKAEAALEDALNASGQQWEVPFGAVRLNTRLLTALHMPPFSQGCRVLLSDFRVCSARGQMNPGDGAFYGPKIDITVFDALRRKFQCATVQLDFQLPIKCVACALLFNSRLKPASRLHSTSVVLCSAWPAASRDSRAYT